MRNTFGSKYMIHFRWSQIITASSVVSGLPGKNQVLKMIRETLCQIFVIKF